MPVVLTDDLRFVCLPNPVTYMENSLAKLDRAVTAAAKASGLPRLRERLWPALGSGSGTLSGIPRTPENRSSCDTRRVRSGRWRSRRWFWRNSTRRQTKRQTYFSHFYSNEIGWEKLAEDIQEPLKKALKELPNTKL